VGGGSSVVNNGGSQQVPSEADDCSDDPVTLRRQIARLRDLRGCRLCVDRDANLAFVPCGHLMACAECGAAFVEVPRFFYSKKKKKKQRREKKKRGARQTGKAHESCTPNHPSSFFLSLSL
jgi:hypothetical protein